tara:strand:- start:150 stop:605 length:456 start_codon:yes stop_codon:yes gene_type:complete
VRRFRERDEKLTSIHIFPGVCHGNYPSVREFQMVPYFVFEHLFVNAFTSFPGPGWIPSLNDKLLNQSSENGIVVIVRRAQGEEIVTGFGCVFAKKFQFQVAQGGVQRDRHRIAQTQSTPPSALPFSRRRRRLFSRALFKVKTSFLTFFQRV